MRWVGLVLGLTAAAGCSGPKGSESLDGTGIGPFPDAAPAGSPKPVVDDAGIDASPDASVDASSDTGGGPGGAPGVILSGDPPGDGGPPACSAEPRFDQAASFPRAPAMWGSPTSLPFSCDPLPSTFFFPRPGLDVQGTYARCASFADARATNLAVNPDGSRVALIGIDGIARIVDVASHMVVGVLAPARASITMGAFSPDGKTILTVAGDERVVTAWSGEVFAPLWSVTLPGHTYTPSFGGAAAFSPDGASVLVSPGDDLFRLDAATGTVLATRAAATTSTALLEAAYGMGGQRIAVLEAPVTGMCVYRPNGGTVTILDPATLASLATPVTFPEPGDEGFPGQMALAPGADLLLTSAAGDPTAQAFRLSDGTPLPAPGLTAFPALLTPDGTEGVVVKNGVALQRISDGAVLASTATGTPTTIAISADGETIAAGSGGTQLLGVWHPAAGSFTPICSAELRVGLGPTVATSLSGDGTMIAVDWGDQVRVLQRSDGTPISTIDRMGARVSSVALSPDGADAVVGSFDSSSTPSTMLGVYRTSDGTPVADLSRAIGDGFWNGLWFSDDTTMAGLLNPSGGLTGATLMLIQLGSGQTTSQLVFDEAVTFEGLSSGCAVVVAPLAKVAWRACGGCSEPLFATDTTGGILSLDGTAFLGQNSRSSSPPVGTTLWQVLAAGAVVQAYPPRPEEATWNASEVPVALAGDGRRTVTTAREFGSCYNGPGFTSRIHDVASGGVIDELPPNVTSTSADLSVVAFGPVVWCAR
jgi:WD40 repeat protein